MFRRTLHALQEPLFSANHLFSRTYIKDKKPPHLHKSSCIVMQLLYIVPFAAILPRYSFLLITIVHLLPTFFDSPCTSRSLTMLTDSSGQYTSEYVPTSIHNIYVYRQCSLFPILTALRKLRSTTHFLLKCIQARVNDEYF